MEPELAYVSVTDRTAPAGLCFPLRGQNFLAPLNDRYSFAPSFA